jgi:hypothetical protein
MTEESRRERVVYLFGAGASHACAQAVGSAHSILMRDLTQELADRLRAFIDREHPSESRLKNLMNDVIDERTDVEHIITFLDDSSSSLHRQFATTLRQTFEDVLRDRLQQIVDEQGRVPDDLYVALLDIYDIPNLPEELAGILTTNYDSFLESAIRGSAKRALDVGVGFERDTIGELTRLLKLHGSFEWNTTWPITKANGGVTLWIPPGIQKAKAHYPFNLLWGLAREMLDCDVLRVVGSRLGPNDWDLISLLFATRHTNVSRGPYRVELIDSPGQALKLQDAHPYLGVTSILEIDSIGKFLVSEIGGGDPREYHSLSTEERKAIVDKAGAHHNWFRLWLKQKAEAIYRDLGSVETDAGAVQRFLESY